MVEIRQKMWKLVRTDRQADSYIPPKLLFAGGIMKTWPYKMVASPEEDNLIVFYYLLASEIWPHQKGGLWWEGPNKRRTIIANISLKSKNKKSLIVNYNFLIFCHSWYLLSIKTFLDLLCKADLHLSFLLPWKPWNRRGLKINNSRDK